MSTQKIIRRLVVVRLTKYSYDTLTSNAIGKKGGKTTALIDALKFAETVSLRGDSKARHFGLSARLPVSIVSSIDQIALRRGCSRATLINSCL